MNFENQPTISCVSRIIMGKKVKKMLHRETDDQYHWASYWRHIVEFWGRIFYQKVGVSMRKNGAPLLPDLFFFIRVGVPLDTCGKQEYQIRQDHLIANSDLLMMFLSLTIQTFLVGIN